MMEASAALDAARAGTQLMKQIFATKAMNAYDMFVWGHSQGGHAALWTGQLAETYLAANANRPGPLGTNPFPKAPSVNSQLVPLFMSQGTDDNVVHCVSPQGTLLTRVPEPSDCMSRAMYDSFSSSAYCPAGDAKGHLELNMMRKNGLQSPGSHFGIPGEISAKGLTKSASDLVFEGSPLQKFMTAAFDKTTTDGCTMGIVNPL